MHAVYSGRVPKYSDIFVNDNLFREEILSWFNKLITTAWLQRIFKLNVLKLFYVSFTFSLNNWCIIECLLWCWKTHDCLWWVWKLIAAYPKISCVFLSKLVINIWRCTHLNWFSKTYSSGSRCARGRMKCLLIFVRHKKWYDKEHTYDLAVVILQCLIGKSSPNCDVFA